MPQLDNAKRERFCQEYVVDSNGTQAAIRAGYSAKTAVVQGSQLLRMLNVQQRVAELLGKVHARLEISQESVLREIEETREIATTAEQYSTALKASELKGKHIGMWPQKSEVLVKRIGDLNDDQLDKLDRLLEVVAGSDSGDPSGDKSRAH